MMKQVFFISALLLCAVVPAEEAKVVPEVLNVRARPDSSATIVCTVRKGTVLQVKACRDPNWMETDLPGHAEVWVSKNFIRKDGKLSRDVHFRCGPGVRFVEYENIPVPEKKVRILETRNRFWVRIDPVPGMKGYVVRHFIDLPEKEVLPEEDLSMISFTEGDERSVSMEGTLFPLKKPFRNAGHELRMCFGNESYTFCYLISPQLNLKMWEGRLVRIDGIQRWSKECQFPIVEIEKIAPSWR